MSSSLPSEHRVARLRKCAVIFALVEQAVAALPLDGKAKMQAIAAYDDMITGWFRDSPPTSDVTWLVVRVLEDLGVRGICRDADGITGMMPNGTTITILFTTGRAVLGRPYGHGIRRGCNRGTCRNQEKPRSVKRQNETTYPRCVPQRHRHDRAARTHRSYRFKRGERLQRPGPSPYHGS